MGVIADEGCKPELRLRVLIFEDADLGKWPEEKGQLLVKGRVTADDFARAVQKVAQEGWDTYGATGYNEAWIGDRGFPLRGPKALDAALSYDETPSKDSMA